MVQCWTLILLLFTSNHVNGQDLNIDDMTLDELSAELDELFSDPEDSLSLLSLIDSMLNMDENHTDLSFRLGWSSRVTSAGRDFGIDQQGISPGISLYHSSGLYADVAGFWNSEFDPKYNLTVATLGYLGNIGKRWTYSFSYDHSFFHTTDELQVFPLNNSVGASATLDFKYIYTGIDYNFAFGSETAHRVAWNVSGYIKRKSFPPFSRITFLPTVTILFGNQAITQSYFNIDRFQQIKNLTNQEILRMARSGNYTMDQIEEIAFLRNVANRTNLTERQQERLNQFFTTIEEIDAFGLMNYYISLPVSFSTIKWGVLLSYNYNIPVELSGSEYDSEANGYFSATITYNLSLK